MKKNINMQFVIIFMMITTLSIFLLGCSESGANKTSQEFSGVFSGKAGRISFFPGRQVKFEFNADFIWMLKTSSNNNKTLAYRFVAKNNSTVSFNKAEYMNLAGIEDNKFIISNPCKIEKDKIILYPGKRYEIILKKETN